MNLLIDGAARRIGDTDIDERLKENEDSGGKLYRLPLIAPSYSNMPSNEPILETRFIERNHLCVIFWGFSTTAGEYKSLNQIDPKESKARSHPLARASSQYHNTVLLSESWIISRPTARPTIRKAQKPCLILLTFACPTTTRTLSSRGRTWMASLDDLSFPLKTK